VIVAFALGHKVNYVVVSNHHWLLNHIRGPQHFLEVLRVRQVDHDDIGRCLDDHVDLFASLAFFVCVVTEEEGSPLDFVGGVGARDLIHVSQVGAVETDHSAQNLDHGLSEFFGDNIRKIAIGVDPRPFLVDKHSHLAILSRQKVELAVSLSFGDDFLDFCVLIDESDESPLSEVDDLARLIDVRIHNDDLVVAGHVILVRQQRVVRLERALSGGLRQNLGLFLFAFGVIPLQKA